VTNRPYRDALSEEEAISEIDSGTGTQFDPRVVEAFHRWREIAPATEAIYRADQSAAA
jgi:HD-GYP domain-containing protein (c-di-GMP phosphodiesterase class II)